MMRGLVLAGGKSSRFGSDKALAVYEGRSFLSRAIRVLEDLKLSPWVVTRPDAFYLSPGPGVLLDLLPENGPLGGLYTAMKKFPEDDFLVLTCDMPALDVKTLLPLIREYEKTPVATFYRSASGQTEPFPGIYPRNLFSNIYQNIFEEKLSMHALIRLLEEKNIIQFRGLPYALVNVNRPSDLEVLAS